MKTPREFAHLALYWDADKYQDQQHWPNCDRLTKLIAARDDEWRATVDAAETLGFDSGWEKGVRDSVLVAMQHQAATVAWAIELLVEHRERGQRLARALGKPPMRVISPFGQESEETCSHEWEPHVWEADTEYCPYCGATRPRDAEPEVR